MKSDKGRKNAFRYKIKNNLSADKEAKTFWKVRFETKRNIAAKNRKKEWKKPRKQKK